MPKIKKITTTLRYKRTLPMALEPQHRAEPEQISTKAICIIKAYQLLKVAMKVTDLHIIKISRRLSLAESAICHKNISCTSKYFFLTYYFLVFLSFRDLEHLVRKI